MCTVLFIPNKSKSYFASLRDESPSRATNSPEVFFDSGCAFIAPTDALSGGTWIGVNEYQNIIILLNGGFENHEKNIIYKKSRGLIVSELLTSKLPVLDWNLMDLEEIEPFTLIVYSEELLFQLVWDGTSKHRKKIDTKLPYIWSSSTLYNQEAKTKRERLFQNWMALNPNISELAVLDFLKSFEENQNGFIMNRNNKVRTLSYSFLEIGPNEKAIFNYLDLINNTYHNKVISVKTDQDCSII